MSLRSFAFIVALLTALVQSGAVLAHASLVRAEPADGALVAEPPAMLRLTFNEPVTPLVMRLIAPDGTATLRIPVAGQWIVRVELLISDFEKIVLEDDVRLPRLP